MEGMLIDGMRQQGRRKVRHIGRGTLLAQYLVELFARNVSRRVRRKSYPLMAVVPSDAIGQAIFAHGLYEEDLLRALFDQVLHGRQSEFLEGIALDVGANVGNHSLHFAHYFERVIAFEPNPPVAKIFEANVALNDLANVTLIPVGLSDEERDLTFMQNDRGNLGGSGFCETAPAGGVGRHRLLPVRRGDQQLEAIALDRPVRLIKLDVEGHELAALRGLERTIEQHGPIVLFESHRTAGEAGGGAIVEWLAKRGYTHVYSIGPRWVLPPIFSGPLIKLASLFGLLFGWIWGGHFWLERLDRLDERSYPLLMVTREPI